MAKRGGQPGETHPNRKYSLEWERRVGLAYLTETVLYYRTSMIDRLEVVAARFGITAEKARYFVESFLRKLKEK